MTFSENIKKRTQKTLATLVTRTLQQHSVSTTTSRKKCAINQISLLPKEQNTYRPKTH